MKSLFPSALALVCSLASAQVPADFYLEKARSVSGGRTTAGAVQFSGDTPHTGEQRHVFRRNEGGIFTTQVATFDSNPAPYVRVDVEAWRQPDVNAYFGSEMHASLEYGFTVTGPANSLVPVRFQGRYEINNDSFLTASNALFAITTSGMDFTRPDQVGLFAQCDGTAVTGRCFKSHESYPSVNSSIQSTINLLGFDIELKGIIADGTFQGVLMAPTDASGRARGSVLLKAAAYATAARDQGRSGVSWSFIDPELQIDPDYLAQFPQAMLLLTPGVGNQMVPVPEPSAATLLLAGLGSLLVWRRRAAGRS